MTAAPGLIRYAARFTRSLHDAEDAYQRAMEIALTRAPVVEPKRFMAWLRTVLRNEALAVSAARRREGPGAGADVAEELGEALADGAAIDVLAEWRERYRVIQDGLANLTEAQRICLMLQTAGASYERIRDVTGYSLRKVERSVLEGRAGLVRWELRVAAGEACKRVDESISRVAANRATPKERRAVARHVKHCGPCRAILRERRQSNEWLAALVPVALIGGHVFAGAPDPTPMFPWWERVASGARVRVGTAVQMAMDLPGTALAKVGAGTAAVVVAGAAAIPLVSDGPRSRPAPAQVAEVAVAPTRARERTPMPSVGPPAARGTEATPGHRSPQRRRAQVAAQRRPRAERGARTATHHATALPAQPRPGVLPAGPAPAPVIRRTPAPTAAPGPPRGSVALEFGP